MSRTSRCVRGAYIHRRNPCTQPPCPSALVLHRPGRTHIDPLNNASTTSHIHRKSIHGPAASGAAKRNVPGGGLVLLYPPIQSSKIDFKLYPSFDSIIILNARTLAFIRALAVWEAFPGALHTTEAIRCLSIDPGMRLVRVTSVYAHGAAVPHAAANYRSWLLWARE